MLWAWLRFICATGLAFRLRLARASKINAGENKENQQHVRASADKALKCIEPGRYWLEQHSGVSVAGRSIAAESELSCFAARIWRECRF